MAVSGSLDAETIIVHTRPWQILPTARPSPPAPRAVVVSGHDGTGCAGPASRSGAEVGRRVVLVTGPPCAGKTTYVHRHATDGDLVLDQDTIGQAAMRKALAQVAAMPSGTAWVIRCCPGPRARRSLADQIRVTERVHLVEPEHVLINRAAHRPDRRRHIAAVSAWFAKERQDAPPKAQRRGHKGSTTQRGYGWAHQQARQRALAELVDGQPCPRCRRPMRRAESALLDLDHTDDRAGYRGLAHRSCNRRAGQANATASRTGKQAGAPRRSRAW